MKLTLFSDAFAKEGEYRDMPFSEVANYPLGLHENKKKTQLAFFGRISDDNRSSGYEVLSRDGIVLDFDHIDRDITQEVHDALSPFTHTVYSTHSHDPDNNHQSLRAVLETKYSTSGEDYPHVVCNFVFKNPRLKKLYDEGYLDMSIKDIGRPFFLPSAHPDRKEKVYRKTIEGIPLKPDTTKSEFVKNYSSGATSVELKDGKIPLGSRNNALASVCGRYINQFKNIEMVRASMKVFNQQHCEIPVDDNELNSIINNISKRHSVKNPDDFQTIDDIIGNDDEDIDLDELEEEFRALSIDDLLNRGEVDWFVHDLIVKQSLSMIYGQSGATKSFLALHMGIKIARGESFFNHDVDTPSPVLYNCLEGAYGLGKRVQGIIDYYQIDKPNNFIANESDLELNNEKSVRKFIKFIKSINFKNGLIIIDTYNNATPNLEENNSSGTGQVMKHMKAIARVAQSSVMVIHHSDKGVKDYRGSTALGGRMDTIIRVDKEGKFEATWTLQKSKESEEGITMKYSLEQHHLGVDKKNRPINTLVVIEEGVTKPKKSRQKLGPKQQYVWNIFEERMKAYPDGDDYEQVIKDVASKAIDYPSNKRTNEVRNKFIEFQNKELVSVGADYPSEKVVVRKLV